MTNLLVNNCNLKTGKQLPVSESNMSNRLMSFSDLQALEDNLLTAERGVEVANEYFEKFIGSKGLSIVLRPEQRTTREFWKGFLSLKLERLKRLKRLELTGFCEDTALDLAVVMHDLNIVPRSIYFDGVDVDKY